jgi:hypothetical protein
MHEARCRRQRDELCADVEDGCARVRALLDERAVGGPDHDHARLLGGDQERASNDFCGDQVIDIAVTHESILPRPAGGSAQGATVLVVEVPWGGMMPTSKM